MKRIICIGNPLVAEDPGGFEVFERLRTMTLPEDVELVDGGLAGLDLLRLVDGAERVVFVDCVDDEDARDGLVVLDAARVAECCDTSHFEHAAGLPWLLEILPGVAERRVPPIHVVGIPLRSGDRTCWKAAAMCLHLIRAPGAVRSPASNERSPS